MLIQLPRILHRFLSLPLILLLLSSAPLHSQTPTSLGKEGQEAFQAGNYEEAAAKFREFIQKFPNEDTTDVARYFAGLSLFALQKYDDAIALLSQASQTKVENLKTGESNIVPDCLFYLGKAYQSKAAGQPVVAERDATLKKSVEAFNQLIETFPDSPLKGDALLARAVSFVQMRDFARAQTDLEALKAADPNNPLNADIDYMLGFVFSEQAQALVEQFKQDEANEVIQKARAIYTQLAASDNLAIANEARFQLANLYFNEQRFDQARSTFRSIRSKDAIIQSQEQIIANLQARIQASQEKFERDRLTRALQRERDKLNEAKNNPELAVAALIRIGETFMAERRFDEARTMFRYAKAFAEEDSKKSIDVQIIISLALQGQANKANEAFEKFKAEFPRDPIAETVEFSIGVAMLQQQRFDEALKSFEESLKNFPNSRVAPQIPSMIARTYLSMGKPDQAIKSYSDFITRAEKGELRVPPETIERAKKDQALALAQVNRLDDAIDAMRKLSETARTEDVKQDAAYQTAVFLMRANKLPEAAAAFTTFAQTYPNHSMAPTASFTLININERLQKPAESIAAARAFLTTFPDHPLAPRAYERIWKTHLAQKDFDGMIQIHNELFEKFPDSEFTVFALWDQAKALEDQRKIQEALEAYPKVFNQFQTLKNKGSVSAENTTVRSFAGFALNRAATIRQKFARDLGNPSLLEGEQLERWKSLMTTSLNELEKVITQTNEIRAVQGALRLLVENVVAQVNTGMMDRAAAINLLSRLAGSATVPSIALQIQIARANLAFDLGLRQQAIEYYSQAMDDPNAQPSWQDLERYGEVLLDNREFDKAFAVFSRIQKDFESDKNSIPVAIYGLGAAQLGRGNTSEAAALFSRLKSEFPNSPKVLAAAYGEGLGLVDKGEYEKAFELWRDVLRSPRASNEIKARTLISYGQALEKMADKNLSPKEAAREDGKPPANPRELAITYYTRVDLLFEAQAEQAAEGLYHAIQAARKLNLNDQASLFLQTLQSKYPTSPWANRARQGT
ncbi:MAG: tetratricopeptide repeat protein [Verrucomicrobiia bacterium]